MNGMFLLCLQNSFTIIMAGHLPLLFSETTLISLISGSIRLGISISWPYTNSLISKDGVTVTTLDSLYHVTNVGGWTTHLKSMLVKLGEIFPKWGMKIKNGLNLKPPPIGHQCLLYFRRGTDICESWSKKRCMFTISLFFSEVWQVTLSLNSTPSVLRSANKVVSKKCSNNLGWVDQVSMVL